MLTLGSDSRADARNFDCSKNIRSFDIRPPPGASAPLKELQKKFGFEPDQVAAVAKKLLPRK
jgi:hypothetical protein